MQFNPFKKPAPAPCNPEWRPFIAKALATSGGHLLITAAGYTLFFGENATLTGVDCDPMKEACAFAGLPIIDARHLPRHKTLSLSLFSPMTAVGTNPHRPPYNALSIAPLNIVAAHYQTAGAEITNLGPAELRPPL